MIGAPTVSAEEKEFKLAFADLAKRRKTYEEIKAEFDDAEKYQRFIAYKNNRLEAERVKRGLAKPSATLPSSGSGSSLSTVIPVDSDPSELTDREKVIFPQLFAKLNAGEWDLDKVERFFIASNSSAFGKFLDYRQGELLKERAELEAQRDASIKHRDYLFRCVDENNAVIRDALVQAASKIVINSDCVKVSRKKI